MLNDYSLFDAHLHIIDPRFPLVANGGYLPDTFTTNDYLTRMQGYRLAGGAIVSGSFQVYDQSYLLAALQTLGDDFVGVTQLPTTVTDDELLRLNAAGVRAVRFNVQRGGSEHITHLDGFARRIHEVVGWHAELYMDSRELPALYTILVALPAVSVDHLGLSKEGLPMLLKLVEHGVHVKATGFGRVDFDVPSALRDLYSANPDALMFGTDLPSTRAPRPYTDADFMQVIEVLGIEATNKVLYQNAAEFYRVKTTN